MHVTDDEGESRAIHPRHPLKFRQLPGLYAIIRFAPGAIIPNWATKGDFTSITRTTDEISVVCSTDSIPKEINPGPRWICLKLEGPFPFSNRGAALVHRAAIEQRHPHLRHLDL